MLKKLNIYTYHLLRAIFFDNFSRTILKNGLLKNSLKKNSEIFENISWWAPVWYFYNSLFLNQAKSISIIDDAKIGIGDSFYILGYMEHIIPKNVKTIYFYAEPRLIKLYETKKTSNFSRNIILKNSILSHQKFKSLYIQKSFLGYLGRFILKLFLLTRKNLPIPLFVIERLIKEEDTSKLSLFSSPISKKEENNLNNIYFTFDCAKKYSNLPFKMVEYICNSFKPTIIQHTSNEDLIIKIKSLEKNYKLKNSYLGFDPGIQISLISKSNLLIAVASSAAKFALVLNCPLFLILFKSFNGGFKRYLIKENLVYSSNKLQIYENEKVLIFRYDILNEEFNIKILRESLETYYDLTKVSYFTNILNR